MTGRVFERKKRRMPCSATFEGQKHSGLVLDVSPGGLFIQTSAKAKPGDRLDVNLSIPGEVQMVHMQVEVARKVVVPPRLLALAHGGIGVRILQAPEAYYTFMETLGIGADPGEFSAEATRKKRAGGEAAKEAAAQDPDPDPAPGEAEPERELNYQVRIRQIKGSRSRVLEVVASSESDAERVALAEAGDGWQLLDMKEL